MNHFNQSITFLNFDRTLEQQEMLHEFAYETIDFLDLKGVQGYCSMKSASVIQSKILKRNKLNPVFIGNGNYHYVSYFLQKDILQPYTLVLFDHHTDAMPYDSEVMSCGSWVALALDSLPNLEKVIIIGAGASHPIEDSHRNKVVLVSEKQLNKVGVKALLGPIINSITTENIYISIDKDVLFEKDAYTNWDQGSMSLLQLLFLLRDLNEKFEICGLDVCGEFPLNPTEMLIFNPKLIKNNEIANRAILDELMVPRVKESFLS